MHVKAAIPENAFGSPIVTIEGRVLGVHAETATPDAGLDDLHYAAIVPPDLADAALAGQATELWEPALVEEEPADVSEVP
jgi:hypothetical protein